MQANSAESIVLSNLNIALGLWHDILKLNIGFNKQIKMFVLRVFRVHRKGFKFKK